MYYMLRSQIATEIDRVSDADYGGQQVPDDVEKDIARRIMGREVYQRDGRRKSTSKYNTPVDMLSSHGYPTAVQRSAL